MAATSGLGHSLEAEAVVLMDGGGEGGEKAMGVSRLRCCFLHAQRVSSAFPIRFKLGAASLRGKEAKRVPGSTAGVACETETRRQRAKGVRRWGFRFAPSSISLMLGVCSGARGQP